MEPFLCQYDCSTNISALTSPTSVPDFALSGSYALTRWKQQCSDLHVKYEHLPIANSFMMHNSETADIVTSLDIVYSGGTVFADGLIVTRHNQALHSKHCFGVNPDRRTSRPAGTYDVTRMRCYRELFVITDFDKCYYPFFFLIIPSLLSTLA